MNATAPRTFDNPLGAPRTAGALSSGAIHTAEPMAEIPSLLDEHRQVNDNLHGYIDDLEKRLIPYMNNQPFPETGATETPQRPIVTDFGCQQNDQIQRTRSGQQRLANIAMRLGLCITLLFSLSSCVNPDTGNREFLGMGAGQWAAFGIGFGKKAAPIAKDEFLAAREVTASK